MKTTLKQIRTYTPCRERWAKLLAHLGKSQADDEPLLIETILESNGLDDALWCLQAVEGHDQEIRLYAVWCARQVQHRLKNPRSIGALDVAQRYARGRATAEELQAAAARAGDAAQAAAPRAAAAAKARAAEAAASRPARKAVAWAAAWASEAAARSSVWAARRARAAARSKQAAELLRVCQEIEAGRDAYPEEDGR